MSASLAGRQRGAALLALLLILVLGGAWYLTTRLNAASGDFTARNRASNARGLNQAKQALLGYVAQQTADSNPSSSPADNPGAFPCPEAAGNIGTANEGVAAGTCTLPAVGRLPWKTLGIDKPLDASGEPLWYVVANGWAKPNAATNTIINSNCTSDATMTCKSGQLAVDVLNSAVALIIAPGPAMSVQASTGCTARNQARSTPSPTINPADYLECYNTATSSFLTVGPSASFNDQVATITAAEALPLIEAAVADRFQQEFGKLMRTAYSGVLWPAAPVLPYAVPFGNPTTAPANMLQGSNGTFQGLLPGSYAFTASPGSSSACSPTPCTPTPCTPASDPRCDPAFVSWQSAATTITRTGGANLQSYSCSTSGTPSTLTCVLNTYTDLLAPVNWMSFSVSAPASNVGMTLRQLNGTVPITGLDTAGMNPPYGYSLTPAAMNTDGSATVNMDARVAINTGSLVVFVVTGLLCSVDILCYQNTISIPMAVLSDHPLVDPSNTAYSWFFRNKWHEVSYYALASGIAPSGARSCTTGTTCLQLAYDVNSGKQRALLMIGGPKLSGQTRPAVALTDLFEGANADGTSPFERRSSTLITNRTFNDHFAVIDSN